MDFIGLFFSGPHITEKEKTWTINFLSLFQKDFIVKEIDPLKYNKVKENTKYRCYYCKLNIFSCAKEIAKRLNRPFVLDGTNFTDTLSFRPGLIALEELKIISPWKEVGMFKEEILVLNKKFKLPCIGVSRSCLLTRFAYGFPIDKKLLCSIKRAEDNLLELGFKNFRVRVAKEGFLLHIDVKEKRLYESLCFKVEKVLKEADLYPYKTAFMKNISGYFDRI